MRYNKPLLMCLTNIPNPYRLHEFEYISRELERLQIRFEAVFMAKTEPGRHWKYRSSDWSFPSWISWGLHPHWSLLAFHINPFVLLHLIKMRPSWLLVGGSWTIPTATLAAIFAKLLLPKTVVLFWAEATLSYSKYSRTGWRHSIKWAALSPYDGFVAPGKRSEDYLIELFGDRLKPIIRLPNYVDENVYSLKVEQFRKQKAGLRKKYRLGSDPVFLIPARLIPEKGIEPFLAALGNLPTRRFHVLLAGDGPLEKRIKIFIERNTMSHVRLLGHKDLPELLELYALSDALVLPSPREPYGFVAVEALWAGLPLILSQETGALPEVLVDGVNGWQFDPGDCADIARKMLGAIAAGTKRLSEMGNCSRILAQERFDTLKSAESFVEALLKVFPSRRQ